MSDAFQGWVDIRIDLADGDTAQIVTEAPVANVDSNVLRKDSAYPVDLTLDCDVSRFKVAPGTVRATLRRGLSDPTGLCTFIVREQDVLPDD